MDNVFANILDAALRAPSPHNTQPWLIKNLPSGVEIYLSKSRTLPAVDKMNYDILRSVGCCLENIRLAIENIGYEIDYKIASEVDFTKPLVTITWSKSINSSIEKELYRMIPIRRTSRLPYKDIKVPSEVMKELNQLCKTSCKLYSTDEAKEISQIQDLVKEATLIQFENESISEELYSWLRFSKKDFRWYRDGLNAECLELSKLEIIASKYLLLPKILKLLCKFNLHKLIFSNAAKHSPRTNMICLLVTNKSDVKGIVESGMVLQRIWLTSAKYNLVTHPLSAAIDVDRTCSKIRTIFKILPEESNVNLFRLGYSKKCHRSPRITVSEMAFD